MRKQLPWNWRIKAIGEGPDYVFIAEFDLSDSQRLVTLVRQLCPAGYVRNDPSSTGYTEPNCVSYEDYLDKSTYSP